jgi:succinate dehydrogenase hydrophobic anchor subunit
LQATTPRGIDPFWTIHRFFLAITKIKRGKSLVKVLSSRSNPVNLACLLMKAPTICLHHASGLTDVTLESKKRLGFKMCTKSENATIHIHALATSKAGKFRWWIINGVQQQQFV